MNITIDAWGIGSAERSGHPTTRGASPGNRDAVPGREEMSMPDPSDERIGTVNVWELHHFRAPIQRIVARRAIDRLELDHYLRELLATRRWDVVRAVPRCEDDGHPSDHVYEVYGRSWSASS
jgi:hypothetical protein